IKSIESFNLKQVDVAVAGYSSGLTLTEQVFVHRGEIICIECEARPNVNSTFKANVFWMGWEPFTVGKEYTLKLATEKISVHAKQILKVLDASNLKTKNNTSVRRYEVAECILECKSQLVFDLFQELQNTGRYIIVDGYDTAGGGIITESIPDTTSELRNQVHAREDKWEHSTISSVERSSKYGQNAKVVLITGLTSVDKKTIAKRLERKLFEEGRKVYFLGIGNILRGLDGDISKEERSEHVRRLGEVANILLDAGLIVFLTASDLEKHDIKVLDTILSGEELLKVCVVQELDVNGFMYDLVLTPEDTVEVNVRKIIDLLDSKDVFFRG
ncbi:MAG: adenylyl-sulfate kinase, partial [Candidatus Altiarchaeales archaeon]|nr:adenylyl-sulfate kinase [Candidatus Altiarchaeales archaeon]